MAAKKALFIGGTGTISAAVTRRALESGWDITLLNRGGRNALFSGAVTSLVSDIHDEARTAKALAGRDFDVVADFIAFTRADVERDARLFRDRTGQYMTLSSASAYRKPPADWRITESTPLANPFWQYSRDKIAMEDYLMACYRDSGFPVTIVRPSHTYDERRVPLAIHGKGGSYQVLARILAGKKVIIHGDGESLWTITHNSDFAEGFTGLMGNPRATGEVVQITSDEALSWNQIYRIIADALRRPLRACHVASDFLASTGAYDLTGSLLGDKAYSVVFDNRKLKRLLPGFCAKVSASEGLRQTVDYVMEHPECQTEDAEFDLWCDKVISFWERPF